MIGRDVASAAGRNYDLIIIGGGVYGIALTLEAARRGFRSLLLERGDYGGETSWNSLRIAHGGLRYLQTADFRRHRESVAERRWLLTHFPDLVKPLPCLMPLYGRGARRPGVLRVALGLDNVLARHRNDGVSREAFLPPGRIVSPEQTVKLCPTVDREGLQGGALWYDAAMPHSQRLLIEMLHWAVACGATALNYVEADRLLKRRDRVIGVSAVDRVEGRLIDVHAPVVVNCAGASCRDVARRFDRDLDELFHPSLAFNVLLDRQPFSHTAIAVTPRSRDARTYFLHGVNGKILAGTYHAPHNDTVPANAVSDALLSTFLAHLNLAIPSLEVSPHDVLRVHWGMVPARRPGSAEPAIRETILHHAESGGPRGLVSVSGVKFTTARSVAEKTLREIAHHRRASLPSVRKPVRPPPTRWYEASDFQQLIVQDARAAARYVRTVIENEAVVHLDDLMLRRTDWGMDPTVAGPLGAEVAKLMGW
ncbi:MAG: FAD-dependent oxidoreductase, partial [Gemmatimonadetes bacterium]|nr:FAD-dependent oxidoreductase [Gemmatimonadota bacterium]